MVGHKDEKGVFKPRLFGGSLEKLADGEVRIGHTRLQRGIALGHLADILLRQVVWMMGRKREHRGEERRLALIKLMRHILQEIHIPNAPYIGMILAVVFALSVPMGAALACTTTAAGKAATANGSTIVFAKDERTKDLLQSKWRESVLERKYIAFLDADAAVLIGIDTHQRIPVRLDFEAQGDFPAHIAGQDLPGFDLDKAVDAFFLLDIPRQQVFPGCCAFLGRVRHPGHDDA